MVQFAGKYKLEKNENLTEYFKEIGVPEEAISKIQAVGSTTDVIVDGNKYTFNSSTGINISFTLDQEFEETFPGSPQKLKSKARKEGDTIIISTATGDGRSGERRYEFSSNGYVLILGFKGVTAKRHFAKI